MKYNLSIVSIFKNESHILREWLEFHMGVGVEHFFLYDNDSTDEPLSILRPYIENGVVTYSKISGTGKQYPCYDKALRDIQDVTKWAAFIDCDEFLFSPKEQDLKKILMDYDEYVSVAVNWVMFGSSGFVQQPEKVVTSFLLREKDVNNHVKCIVKPAFTYRAVVAHAFLYHNGMMAVNENKNTVSGAFNEERTTNILRINHYYIQSNEQWNRKLSRGRADIPNGAPVDRGSFDSVKHLYNDVKDFTILERISSIPYYNKI